MNTKLIETFSKNYNNNNFSMFEADEHVRDLFKILEDKKIIKLQKNGKIKKINPNTIYIGTLEVRKHFGFLYSPEDSYYVHDTKGYISGDYVVGIKHEGFSGDNIEVKLLGLLQRSERKIICKVLKDKKLQALDEKYNDYSIHLDNEADKVLINERQIIQVQVEDVDVKKVSVKLINVIADGNDPDLQMKIVLATYEIDTTFSENILKEIESIEEPTPKEYEGRVDLRDETFMTIDGADSKDLDDAVMLIKEGNNYRLYVSIADVSYYVKENSSLDIDAHSKATSVYFIDRVVPMLPKKLSNGICSLNPNVDRLTQTCEMLIDPSGKVIDYKIYDSVINSKYRLTYSEVNALLHDNIVSDKLKPIYSILKEMDKLRKILNVKRLNRGAFNLEDKDAKFTLNEDGEIIKIDPVVRQNGEKLIEEFMIVANETVASAIYYMDLPFIYRIHDQPNIKKIKDVMQSFSLFGITLKGDIHEFKPQMFKQALDQVDDPVSKRVLSDIIVRSLSKARYQPKNIGHFGLASDNYTHFTSPIRRYPDLIVHRKLRQYLMNNQINYTAEDVTKLEEIGKYTSEKEVNAIKASQKIEDQKKATYMKQFIGQEFSGVIASILDYGFFIELDNTVRGLIKFRNIKEFVRLDNSNRIIFSNDVKVTLGDRLTVIVDEVNENQGLIEFSLKGFTMKEKKEVKKNYKKREKKSTKDKKPANYNSKNRRRKKYSEKDNKKGRRK